MSEPLHPIVIDVTHGLLTAEQANDRAIASTAGMIQTMVADRNVLHLKFGEIQASLSDAAKAIALGVEMRAHLGRCHRKMHELGVEHEFFDVTSHGDVFPTTGDDTPIKQSATGSLVGTV